ncbi:MAG: hypothetical protein LH481_09825 [Burkholderiales bacterium]|nr:hypothetical protein [Burkholderiales bacterium]
MAMIIANSPVSALLSLAEKFQIADDNEAMERVLVQVAHHDESMMDDFHDSINIAMEAHAPELAIKLVEIFERRFGQKYQGDCSREEIERELPNIVASRRDEIVFKRMGFLERGHVPNRATLSPILQISISIKGIEILQRRFFVLVRRNFFRWDEISDITIETKKAYKAMGLASSPFQQKTCLITACGQVFVFDVSGSYPDFRRTAQLLATLKKYKPITQSSASDQKQQRRIQKRRGHV